MLSGDGLVGGNPTVNTPRLRREGGIASSSWYSYIVYFVVIQLPSLERWALLPFWGFLLLVFLNLLFLESCIIFFSLVLGLFLGLFKFFYLPYFRLACDHGNMFLCLEE